MISNRRRQHGLTLIEVAVVLILMALLATTVTLGSRGMISGATREGVLADIESIDAAARRYTKQHNRPVRLELERTSQRILLTEAHSQDPVIVQIYQLPNGFSFERPWKLRRGERVEQRSLVLNYDAQAATETWGVTLKSPPLAESERPNLDALLVLGTTGQITRWESNEAAQDILAQARGRDTD